MIVYHKILLLSGHNRSMLDLQNGGIPVLALNVKSTSMDINLNVGKRKARFKYILK